MEKFLNIFPNQRYFSYRHFLFLKQVLQCIGHEIVFSPVVRCMKNENLFGSGEMGMNMFCSTPEP